MRESVFKMDFRKRGRVIGSGLVDCLRAPGPIVFGFLKFDKICTLRADFVLNSCNLRRNKLDMFLVICSAGKKELLN